MPRLPVAIPTMTFTATKNIAARTEVSATCCFSLFMDMLSVFFLNLRA
jgi:hypothetical protein